MQIILTLSVLISCFWSTKATTFDVVYYEQEPFLHFAQDNTSNEDFHGGIVADIGKKALELCNISLNFKYNTKTIENFSNILSDKEKRFELLNRNVMWLALYSDISLSVLRDTNLTSVKLFDSPGIEVFVHQDQIGILRKFYKGLFRCGYLLVLGIMLATVFAVLIWMIERVNNAEFSKCVRGAFTGLWFSAVTISTVGYGDITPKSNLGRLLTAVWIVLGVLINAIITSTITEAVTDTKYLDIMDKTVVAKENTPEARYAFNKLDDSSVTNVSTYDQVQEYIAKKDDRWEAGLMEAYIANAKQTQVRSRNLRFVYKIDTLIPLTILIPRVLDQSNGNATTFRDCITTMDGAVVKAALAHHPIYVKHDTLDTEKPIHLVIKDTPPIIVLGAITVLLFFYGLLFEVYWRCKGKYKSHKSSTRRGTKKEAVPLTSFNDRDMDGKVKRIELKLYNLDDDLKQVSRNMENIHKLLLSWDKRR